MLVGREAVWNIEEFVGDRLVCVRCVSVVTFVRFFLTFW